MKKTLLYLFMITLCANLYAQKRYLGGDISLLPTYEQAGTIYKDSCGHAVEPLRFFHEQEWNAIRLRLFNNPTLAPQNNKDEGVCQDIDYVKTLGARVKAEGLDLMLDFHYSDTWADPAKQFIPHAWEGASAASLADSVYAFTRTSLRTMKAAKAEPDLIQVGNEISFGTLWPIAKTTPTENQNWPELLQILKRGCQACRAECPQAKIIIHTEQAGNWENTRAFYMRLKDAALDYDVIGLSYYPMWHGSTSNLSMVLDSLSVLFPDKEVMIVECAAYYSHENDVWSKSPDEFSEYYPISKAGQLAFTRQLINTLLLHRNVTGLFWWMPEENACQNNVLKSWINRGLFDNRTGEATPALYEMKRFLKKSIMTRPHHCNHSQDQHRQYP